MNRRSISGNNTEQVLQTQITNLQRNIFVTGTNLGVGPGALNLLTTGTDNVAIGLGASSSNYSLTTGSGNVMLGANSGGGCVIGSNNALLGTKILAIVAVKAFLYVGANIFTPHIAAPIYLLCICNKIGENTCVTGP